MKTVIALAALSLTMACASDGAHEKADAPAAHDAAHAEAHGDAQSAHGAEGDKSYTPGKHHGHHRFDDAEQWAARFEDPSRDEWQKPEQVIDWLELEPADKVADIGAATGYFPVRIAKRVPEGKVYGVDIEEAMVTYLNKRATDEGIGNLTAVLGEPKDPKIPELVDVVLLVNTYHHIEDRTAYFTRLMTQTNAGAKLAIVDFKKGDLGMGPPDAMKLAPEAVEAELTAAGWTKKSQHELDKQYVLVFERAEKPEG
jgi:ubiquinone/menaquinone biosynthesis C-methylase UbiE